MNLKVLFKRAAMACFMCMLSLVAFAQRTISGLVKETTGEPMIGVNILVKGTTNGTITDFNGNFTLNNVPSSGFLVISYIGYLTQEIKMAGQKEFSVVMKEDNKTLDEVVVVGYGVVKKSDLTGSVGSVKADELVAKGSTSAIAALQGQIAGVNIQQASSRVGDSYNIQIRGKSSLQGGSPLYVIDGVVCDNMDFLNPMDIEKIDVLKDASSTAIYGSRATNGVLMITTKKGSDMNGSAKATVSYDGYWGYKTTANMPEFMDGDEFMKYRFSRYVSSKMNNTTGETAWTMTSAQLSNVWGANSAIIKQFYLDKNYTDWPDLVTCNGQQQNHFVNVTGNAHNISYRFGLGYQDEEGILYDSYSRWNLKGAVEHKISDQITAGFSTNMSTSLIDNGSQNSVSNGFAMTPVMKDRYWEGDKVGELILQPGKDACMYPNGGGPTSTYNPIVDRENSKDRTRKYDIMANLYLQYSPIKSVILKTTFSPSYIKSQEGVFYGAKTETRRNQGVNYAEDNMNEYFSYTWDTQANYLQTWGDHSLNALALFSIYQMKNEGNGITVVDMPFDVDWYNVASGTVQNQSSYYTKYSMLSYVARVNYGYKNRYLLTVSSRWDGSSKFKKGHRWGMFPSAAVAWRINEEDFMKSASDWLSNLKFRLSYGITGNNSAVGAYDTQSTANVKYYYNFGTNAANGYGYTLSNSDLTWEKTSELNVGLDYGFFNNRISGSIDWYNRISRDLLMEMETPLELGSYTGSIWDNVGKVKNTGIELQLSTINVRNKNWNWTTSFTFAHNHNEILELNGGKTDLVGNWWFIGQPIDVVYGYKHIGVCTAEEAAAYASDASKKTKFYEGEMKIADTNNDGTITADDKIIQGHCAPTWTGSFTSSLTYKNLDFSVTAYTSQGAMVASPFIVSYTSFGSRGTQHLKMDYYIPDGAPILGADGEIDYQKGTHYGKYPFPTGGSDNSGCGAYYVNDVKNTMSFVDNSYVKIKNITFGYSFPKKLINKFGASYLRLYVNVLNPFTFTSYKGFDPEWADANISGGQGGPSSRTYQIGVNLKF